MLSWDLYRTPKLKDDTPEMPLWARLLLGPDEPGIETSGHCGVGRALDNGAAVGEQGQFERFTPELENKVTVADSAVRPQALAHLLQIQGAATFVNLHGVAATERNVRTYFARQM